MITPRPGNSVRIKIQVYVFGLCFPLQIVVRVHLVVEDRLGLYQHGEPAHVFVDCLVEDTYVVGQGKMDTRNLEIDEQDRV